LKEKDVPCTSRSHEYDSSSGEAIDDPTIDHDYEAPLETPEESSPPMKTRSHKRDVKTGFDLHLKVDFASNEALVSIANRSAATATDFKRILTTIVEIGGGDRRSGNFSILVF
jgi:hypothetical protein